MIANFTLVHVSQLIKLQEEAMEREDDDFVITSKKRKKREKVKESSPVSEPQKSKGPTERKARNRLSEEEKYNRQLEEALKLSIMDSSSIEQKEECFVASSPSESCIPLTVRVEVMDSPMSKKRKNSDAAVAGMVHQPSSCVSNGAVVRSNDQIVPAPAENNKEMAIRPRSARQKSKKHEDDEYQLSEEIECEDDNDDDEPFEDFQKKPVATKRKKKPVRSESVKKKANVISKPSITKKDSTDKRKSLSSPDLPSSAIPLRTQNISKNSSPLTSPVTPKSTTVLSSVRSPSFLQRKFVQRGWTPPGPAGSRSTALKSTPSPSCIRVGLSRNARISPLHPKTIIR